MFEIVFSHYLMVLMGFGLGVVCTVLYNKIKRWLG